MNADNRELKLTALDMQFVQMMKTCTFGPDSSVVLPSGICVTSDQMKRLISELNN